MKKIILFALFFIASITCFCQYTLIFSIKTDSTPFPRILPSNSIVFVIDSINETYDGVSLFKTLSIIQKDSSLRSIAHIKTNSHYSKLIDSTHCYVKLKTDSLSSCSPLVIYSNDTSYYTALGHKFNSNVDADSYINTDSSYYIKGIEFIKANHNLGNQFIGVGSGANNIVDSINMPPYGYLGSLNTANGYYSLYNNTMGLANTAIGVGSLYSNTIGNSNIAIGNNSGQYADTAANGLLWIGEGDYKNAIIYGNMLTDSLRLNANVNVGINLMVNQSATIGTDLTVHGEIINGGLINKDTVLILADDETFNFPKTSVGWAEIQCDSSLIEKTWGVVSWNGDGSTSLRSNGAKFVSTAIDGNYVCFYQDNGLTYAVLKNTSGYTQTYSIKLHYHN